MMKRTMLTTLLILLGLILSGCGTPPDPTFVVDVKPESCPNPLNMKSKGVLPVAILGTEDFDVSSVDPSAVSLMGVPPITWHYEDVSTPVGEEAEECECTEAGPDGYFDLVFHFDTQEVVTVLEELAAFYGGTVEDGSEGGLMLFEGEVPDPTAFPLGADVWSGDEIWGGDCVIIRKKGQN
jgi:hypothetical protein